MPITCLPRIQEAEMRVRSCAVHAERELTRLNISAELTGTLTLHDDYD